ncbi:MAG: class I SAM-dependent methyltransferase [Thermodesulfovibrionales bacterium]|nr:class I SAM-dependent methyltransferase [Thermodesulfovibrionales bacterium]
MRNLNDNLLHTTIYKHKIFWEKKARRYPLPFDSQTLAITLKIIEIVKNKGVRISGSRILDIGCGTGIYTLPLAKEADFVFGLDSSETMISRLLDERNKHNINNVDVIKASWKDLDISSVNFKKAFDVVWVAMSMAVKDEDDIQKMETCSKRWCVYIGWGRYRKNELMEKAFQIHGLRFGPPPGAEAIYKILQTKGRNPTLDFIQTAWDREGSIDDTLEDIVLHIELNDAKPDISSLKSLLLSYAKDGRIYHQTLVEQGIIVWQV